MTTIPLTLPGRNCVVGHVLGGIAVLDVTSKNYLGIAKGFSIDAQVLRAIVEIGARSIEFRHRKTLKRWRISIDDFRACARSFNFGFGEKLAAPLSKYEELMERAQS